MGMGYGNGNENDLVTRVRNEYETIQRRLRENQGMIDQNQAEVKRLEDEHTRARYRLNQVLEQFESVPRPDIRTAYDTIIDVRNRLLTMRNQLEKMQDSQAQLRHYGELLGEILTQITEDPSLMPTSSGPRGDETRKGSVLTPAGETIVRIVQAQEDERQSLAKSLHDGPAQSLTNFILQAEVCQRLFDRNPDRATVELANLKTAASNSFQKIRDFIFDLRPMMLDDLGLVPTLRRYTENFQQKHNIKIDFNSTGDERRLPKHTEVMMFRSLQALLRITTEYLGAKTIRIQVDVGQDRVRSLLEDDGKGFDPEVELDPKQGDSNVQSLNAVRDRIDLVGGQVDIYSVVDEGSRYEIILPIEEEELDFSR